MKRYLVTGGLGFIGSCFVRDILDNETGVFIMNVDCLTYAGNKKNLEDKHWKSGYHRHFNTDIRDKEKVEKLFEIHKDHTKNCQRTSKIIPNYSIIQITHKFSALFIANDSLHLTSRFLRRQVQGLVRFYYYAPKLLELFL